MTRLHASCWPLNPSDQGSSGSAGERALRAEVIWGGSLEEGDKRRQRKKGLNHREQQKWVKWGAQVGTDKCAQRQVARETSRGGWAEGCEERSGLGTDIWGPHSHMNSSTRYTLSAFPFMTKPEESSIPAPKQGQLLPLSPSPTPPHPGKDVTPAMFPLSLDH